MPYKSTSDLPESVRDNLPDHAQDIFKEAFNSAWDEYADPDKRRGNESQEEVSFKVAWSAVKNEYEKGDDDRWHRK
ncbi:putative cation transport regulator ChaB [Frateuria sp. STR12]|uniref:putative cation transport regulator ChaB n=1 Tax=Frateuria hangzhouensis TaxID=2995589 RepID=UPI00226100EF|nr:putative cation transport regulator ChaB [Frateuria sp. STR12]MCX7513593.1 putative cation transport regulator ChaB [Frateuria sp. STR12]